jgi:hypothetical protein
LVDVTAVQKDFLKIHRLGDGRVDHWDNVMAVHLAVQSGALTADQWAVLSTAKKGIHLEYLRAA